MQRLIRFAFTHSILGVLCDGAFFDLFSFCLATHFWCTPLGPTRNPDPSRSHFFGHHLFLG